MNRAVNKTQISVVISVLCAMVFYFDTVSAQIIDIKTRNLSMIMGVNTKGELLLHHFGGKITDSSAFVHYSGYPTLGPTVYSTLSQYQGAGTPRNTCRRRSEYRTEICRTFFPGIAGSERNGDNYQTFRSETGFQRRIGLQGICTRKCDNHAQHYSK
jgi:hypothetical protein